MTWQTVLYFSSILLTCVLTGFLAWYAWKHRHVPGSSAYAWLALSECLLALTEILSVLSPSMTSALFWFRTRYPIGALIAVFWLVFAIEYSGHREWISKRLLAGIFVVPLVTQILLWSNSLHGLWMKQEAALYQIGRLWIADISSRIPELGYLTHSFYNLFLTLAGIALMLLTAWGMRRELVGQALILAGAGLTALFFVLNSLFGLLPKTEFNIFTPGIGLSVLLIALAVFRFDFLKRAPAQEDAVEMTRFDTQEKYSLAGFILIFILFTSGLAAASYVTYQNYEEQFRAQVDSQLGAIASLKTDELQDWRDEHLAHADLFYHNENFSEWVWNYLEDPQDAEAQAQLLTWMEKIKAFPEYDRIFLLDIKGVERLSLPADPEAVPAELVEQASASLALGQVVFLDFHRHLESDAVHLSMLVPIYDAQDNQPLGVLVLRIDPNVYLYPFIQRWPVPSASAETLLIRQDGEEVVYLNPLRFQPDTALNLRFFLADTQLPAVNAVLGQTGIVEGLDYRNILVFADIRAVPDSLWFLVSKMDRAEVYAPLRSRLWQTILFFGTWVLAAGAGLLLSWRQQRVRFYRGQLEAAEEVRASEEKFRLAFETSPDSVAITRVKDGMFVSVNKGFEQITGYLREEVIGKTSLEINIWKDPADRRKIVEGLQARGEVRDYEAPFLTREGEIVGLMSAVIIELSGEPHILNIVRDITERKQAEQELKRIEWLLSHRHQPSEAQEHAYTPPYGDLVSLNTCRLILDSVGEPTLKDIVGDYLDLLDTSAAVYERNGDYALGIFSSGWCRFMDAASRSACGTDNNREALDCGRWHCHESCWSRASKTAIETGQPADIECDGGLRLYAMPIRVGDEVIGSINFGYGDPPQDEAKLRELASKYQVSYEELRTYATEYESRPPYIIELAKHRLHASARLIGEITERKQAEDALRESRAILQAALDNSPAGIAIADAPDGKLRYVNNAGLLIRGGDRQSIVEGIGIDKYVASWQLLDLDGRPLKYDEVPLARAVLFGETNSREFIVRRTSDDDRIVLGNAAPIMDERGKITAGIVIFTDITERKQAQDALLQSENLLNKIFDVLPVGIWLADKNGQLMRSNQIGREIWGAEPLVGQEQYGVFKARRFPSGEELASEDWALARTIKEGVTVLDEMLEIDSFDGKKKVILNFTAPVFDAAGNVEAAVIINLDITERKRAEEALRASEEKFHSYIQYAPDGVFISDEKGNYVEVNSAACHITGYSEDELLKLSIPDLLFAEDLEIGLQHFKNVNDKGFARNEIGFVTKSGEKRFWNVAAVKLSDTRFLGFVQDTTERKRAEEELKQSQALSKTIIDSIPGTFYMIDASGKYVGWNAYQRDEIVGQPESLMGETYAIDTIHLDDRRIIGEKIENVLKNGAEEVVEGRVLLRGGPNFQWLLMTGTRVMIKDSPVLVGIGIDITKRKRAEEALRESEARLRAIFDATPFPIALVDFEDDEIDFWSHSAVTLFGHIASTTAEWYEIAYPDPDYRREVIERWKPALEKARLTAKEVNTGEYRVACRDGSVRICELYAAFLGRKLIVTFNDITKRKQAEDELRVALIKYKTLFDCFPQGITVSDEAGKILETNSAAVRLLGVPHEEHTRRGIDDAEWKIVRSDGTPMPAEEFPSVMANKEKRVIENVEVGIVKADNSITWISVNAAPLPVEGYGVVVTYGDITERKLAEESLRESEARFRQMFENHDAVMLLIEPHSSLILDANRSASKFYGYEYSKLCGMNINEINLLSPEQVADERLSALSEERNYLVFPHRLFNGEERIVEVHSSPITFKEKQVLFSIIHDITERRQAQEQLIKTLEELKRSNAELEQFAYVASHDLQEPLRAVAGMVQLLQKRYQGQLDERADEYIRLAVDGASRMQTLIKDLLAYSRIERHGNPIKAADVNKTLKSALRNLESAIAEQGAVVTSENLPTLNADAPQLTQLFQNLIGNAIKFHGTQPPQVHVGVEKLADAWRFSVRDNGIGIEPQYFERVFLVFQRLHTHNAYSGTGIGLSICKKIVERHGGRIWIDSQFGQGSTFYFTIPHRS
jgi:PAS domain S-box-containing protein